MKRFDALTSKFRRKLISVCYCAIVLLYSFFITATRSTNRRIIASGVSLNSKVLVVRNIELEKAILSSKSSQIINRRRTIATREEANAPSANSDDTPNDFAPVRDLPVRDVPVHDVPVHDMPDLEVPLRDVPNKIVNRRKTVATEKPTRSILKNITNVPIGARGRKRVTFYRKSLSPSAVPMPIESPTGPSHTSKPKTYSAASPRAGPSHTSTPNSYKAASPVAGPSHTSSPNSYEAISTVAGPSGISPIAGPSGISPVAGPSGISTPKISLAAKIIWNRVGGIPEGGSLMYSPIDPAKTIAEGTKDVTFGRLRYSSSSDDFDM